MREHEIRQILHWIGYRPGGTVTEQMLRDAIDYAFQIGYTDGSGGGGVTVLLPQDQPALTALGLRLQQARERRNISEPLMAERLGVSLEILNRLEAGDASVTIATLYRTLRIFGLAGDIDWLAPDAEMIGKLLSIQEQK